MALAVLQCLPNLGTHKVLKTQTKLHPAINHHAVTCNTFLFQLCVPMVLQTLQTLASAPKLRAVVMRLMTALWKKQVYNPRDSELICFLCSCARIQVWCWFL